MRILNLEDSVFKHFDIKKAIENNFIRNIQIERIGNLKDGVSKIEESIQQGTPYDLIITDMWYPKNTGGSNTNSGDELIQIAMEKKWNIPIIVCSSISYSYPEILGYIHYSQNEDWETELVDLIKKI